MTEENKQLLLKDLCARLYTGTIVNYDDTEGCDYPLNLKTLCNFPEEKLKCYLRPISSMTEEEYNELKGLVTNVDKNWNLNESTASCLLDFLNAHHFDYRNLIERGLALPAPENMYKFN